MDSAGPVPFDRDWNLLMQVVLLSTDLMFISKIEGAVRNRGGSLDTTSDTQAAADFANSENVALLMIDLTLPGVELVDLLESLPENVRTLAYGPHVHEAKLAAARNAGCDLVVSRGELDRKLSGILEQFLT